MALIECPHCKGKGGFVSSGDGWDEWDECRLCDPKGTSRHPGRTTADRVEAFRKAEAEECARIDKMVAAYEAKERAMDTEYGPAHIWAAW